MRPARQIVGASLVILLGLMAVGGSEGGVSAYPENLFTAGGGHKLAYVTWSRPHPRKQLFVGDRMHFGWPCWALIVDVGNEGKAWYARLDLVRLLANWFLAVGLAVPIVLAARWIWGGFEVGRRTTTEPNAGEADPG